MAELLQCQRAEHSSAIRLQVGVLFVQILITVFACAAVFVPQTNAFYVFGCASVALLLTILWVLLDALLQARRSQSDRARRAVVFSYGFGATISSSLGEEIESGFRARADGTHRHAVGDYYTTAAPAGSRRLAEIVEQSAFWSRDLMTQSSKLAWAFFGVALTATVLTLFLALQEEADFAMNSARAVCVVFTLILSTGTFGAAISYLRASHALDRLLPRLEILRLAQYPAADLYLVVTDYYSIVEKAPLFAPRVYEWRNAHLARAWARRIADRGGNSADAGHRSSGQPVIGEGAQHQA